MRVLVTGAAGGIGAATASVLARHGCDVIATARNPELLQAVPASLRLPLDVTSDESVQACMDRAGEIDVLVNNAGITESGPVERIPIDRVRACLETNTIGPLRMVQAVVPAMRERGSGTVVNITSVSGRVGAALDGAYGQPANLHWRR